MLIQIQKCFMLSLLKFCLKWLQITTQLDSSVKSIYSTVKVQFVKIGVQEKSFIYFPPAGNQSRLSYCSNTSENKRFYLMSSLYVQHPKNQLVSSVTNNYSVRWCSRTEKVESKGQVPQYVTCVNVLSYIQLLQKNKLLQLMSFYAL